jgi:hypothetical protein
MPANRSRGELKIEEILLANDIKFETEYTFPDLVSSSRRPLRFDFAVFDDDGNLDFLIEYQGEQHENFIKGLHLSKKQFEKQQEHDRRKRLYAQEHNINLLEIWYWDFDNIESILEKELLSDDN